jgi:hypothetical protein
MKLPVQKNQNGSAKCLILLGSRGQKTGKMGFGVELGRAAKSLGVNTQPGPCDWICCKTCASTDSVCFPIYATKNSITLWQKQGGNPRLLTQLPENAEIAKDRALILGGATATRLRGRRRQPDSRHWPITHKQWRHATHSEQRPRAIDVVLANANGGKRLVICWKLGWLHRQLLQTNSG